MQNSSYKIYLLMGFLVITLALILPHIGSAQTEEYETIDSEACVNCHETSKNHIEFSKEFEGSTHEGFECLSCHIDKDTIPHKENEDFHVGLSGLPKLP